MILYLNETSPFARFALVVAIENDRHDIALRWVDPWQDEAELVDANPFSMIPTLRIDADTILFESIFIADYLAAPDRKPDNAASLARYGIGKTLMEIAFKKAILDRWRDGPIHPLSERAERALSRMLNRLDRHLIEVPAQAIPPLANANLCLAVALQYIGFRLGALFQAMVGPVTKAWLLPYQNRASLFSTAPDRLQHQPASIAALLAASEHQQTSL